MKHYYIYLRYSLFFLRFWIQMEVSLPSFRFLYCLGRWNYRFIIHLKFKNHFNFQSRRGYLEPNYVSYVLLSKWSNIEEGLSLVQYVSIAHFPIQMNYFEVPNHFHQCHKNFQCMNEVWLCSIFDITLLLCLFRQKIIRWTFCLQTFVL